MLWEDGTLYTYHNGESELEEELVGEDLVGLVVYRHEGPGSIYSLVLNREGTVRQSWSNYKYPRHAIDIREWWDDELHFLTSSGNVHDLEGELIISDIAAFVTENSIKLDGNLSLRSWYLRRGPVLDFAITRIPSASGYHVLKENGNVESVVVLRAEPSITEDVTLSFHGRVQLTRSAQHAEFLYTVVDTENK